MEERKNFTWEEVVQMSEDFPWQPSFNRVIITLNAEEYDGEVVLTDNTMSEVQYVVASGPHTQYKPGDIVWIDLDKMMVRRPNPENQYEEITQIKLDPIYDDEDNMFAIIEDRLIKAKRTSNEPLQSNE